MYTHGLFFVTEFMNSIIHWDCSLKSLSFSALNVICCRKAARRESVEVMIHAFLTSATDEAERSLTRYGRLYTGKGLGSRSVMKETGKRKKIPAKLPGIDLQPCSSPFSRIKTNEGLRKLHSTPNIIIMIKSRRR
jgi:hypothetical protein